MGDWQQGDQTTRLVLLKVLEERSGATAAEIVDATNLFTDGILTSLTLAYVVLDLEARLGLELMDDLHFPHWTTIGSITDILIRKGAGS